MRSPPATLPYMGDVPAWIFPVVAVVPGVVSIALSVRKTMLARRERVSITVAWRDQSVHVSGPRDIEQLRSIVRSMRSEEAIDRGPQTVPAIPEQAVSVEARPNGQAYS